jgi:hypothetical protein
MTPEQLKKQLDWHAGREDSFFNHDRDMFKAIRRVVNEYLKLSATDEDEVRRRNVEGPRGMLRYPTTGATDAEKPLSDAEHATAMLLQDATAPPPGTPASPAPQGAAALAELIEAGNAMAEICVDAGGYLKAKLWHECVSRIVENALANKQSTS